MWGPVVVEYDADDGACDSDEYEWSGEAHDSSSCLDDGYEFLAF